MCLSFWISCDAQKSGRQSDNKNDFPSTSQSHMLLVENIYLLFTLNVAIFQLLQVNNPTHGVSENEFSWGNFHHTLSLHLHILGQAPSFRQAAMVLLHRSGFRIRSNSKQRKANSGKSLVPFGACRDMKFTIQRQDGFCCSKEGNS